MNDYKIPRELMPKWADLRVRGNHTSTFEDRNSGLRVDITASKDCVISLHLRGMQPITLDEAEMYVHDQLREGRLTRRAIRDDVIHMVGNLEAIAVLERFGLLFDDNLPHWRE